MEIIDAKQRVEARIQNGYDFDFEGYLSRGWALFRKNPGPFVVFALLVFVINVALAFIPILGTIASAVLTPVFTAGYFIGCHKLNRENSLEINDFFKAFDDVAQLFLLALISGILVTVGIFLLLLPGIWFGIAIALSYPLLIFARFDFWESITNSVKLVNKKWFHFFGLLIVLGLINLLGMLFLGVGLLITIPFTYCVLYIAYSEIVGHGGERELNIEDHLVDDPR
jgi:hypothetical protein